MPLNESHCVMSWLGKEIIHQMAGRMASPPPAPPPLQRIFVFRFDGGLLLKVGDSSGMWVSVEYSILGAPDGSVLMPPLKLAIKYLRKIRGYSRVLLADGRHGDGTLDPETLTRLGQVSQALAEASWWVVLHECETPRLQAAGFPAWKLTCGYMLPIRWGLVHGPDWPTYARMVLSQVNPMRSILDELRMTRPAAKLEPR